MTEPYLCPHCKTNKTRFNLIEQVVQPVKKDPTTGDIIESYSKDQLSPLHMQYNGPSVRVQCAVCGLIEDEQSFIKRAQFHRMSSD